MENDTPWIGKMNPPLRNCDEAQNEQNNPQSVTASANLKLAIVVINKQSELEPSIVAINEQSNGGRDFISTSI